MQLHDVSYIMIGQGGVLEGIVSKSDLTGAISPYLRPMFAKWRRPSDDATLQIKIKWIMSKLVRTIKAHASVAAVIENMFKFGGGCLPVVDQQGNEEFSVSYASPDDGDARHYFTDLNHDGTMEDAKKTHAK